MVPKELHQLKAQVENLDINETEKESLLQKVKILEKALIVADFQVKRIEKDKTITNNLLKTSVEELESNKSIIEETNKKLLEQKKEVDAKNIELRKQKLVVERQSRQMKVHLKELEHSYSEMEQFTYIASHDLQSPLRTITNFATLLEERHHDQIDGQAKDFIRFITKGAKQMREVIDGLLDFSRVGRKNHQFDKTDLNEVLEMVQFNLYSAIEESQTELIIPPLPTLYLNKSGMIQLFQNLIGNAIKFRAERKCRIEIRCEQLENFWTFQVIDNGLGMDEGFQKKAFLPFQRVNNLDRPGIGIGLAICKKVVKMHRGEITFQSEKGVGTTFLFNISADLKDELEESKMGAVLS